MKNETNNEDSPFYVEYTGKTIDSLTIKMKPMFKKMLEKHLQDKYPQRQASASIRYLLENYLQKQCLSRKVFERTSICLLDNDDFNIDSTIECEYNIKGYTPFYHEQKKLDATVNFYLTNYSSLDTYNKGWLINYDYHSYRSFDKKVDEFKYTTECENIAIMEIPLNNFLDHYHNGIYSFDKSNPNLHCGANAFIHPNKICGVVYEWSVDSGNNTIIHDVNFMDSDSLLNNLSDINKDKYNLFKTIFESANEVFPKTICENVKFLLVNAQKELVEKQNEVDKLKATLKKYQCE